LLVHAVLLFLTFVCQGKKDKKGSGSVHRPEGMGTDKSPAICIKRGVSFGIKPDLNGSVTEWLAAVCPGVMRPGKGKKGKKSKHRLVRRGGSQESPWESCVWGMDHGAVCQRCHAGDSHKGKGKKQYPSYEMKLMGCAMRYDYHVKSRPKDTATWKKQLLKWKKTTDASSFPDKGLLDSVCPGVFDSVDKSGASEDSAVEACKWGWKHGADCMALGPLSEQIVESIERGCMHRYGGHK